MNPLFADLEGSSRRNFLRGIRVMRPQLGRVNLPLLTHERMHADIVCNECGVVVKTVHPRTYPGHVIALEVR